MKFLQSKSDFPKNVSLILGFFDGVHAGHQAVIKKAQNFGETVLVTFSSSPAEYFKNVKEYIYSREQVYAILEKLGVNYVFELDFSKISQMSACEYLEFLVKQFEPKAVCTGFNHTFGANKLGNSVFLEKKQEVFNYTYICSEPYKIGDEIVSSTYIKSLLKNGDIKKASSFLAKPFTIESTVIHGRKLGRSIGFPTANMLYPQNIVRIPYGVYEVRVLGKQAIMNWGIRPTINSEKPYMEVHILDFNGDLYGKVLAVEIIRKIRDEKQFKNLEELKFQIKKDIEVCSKL